MLGVLSLIFWALILIVTLKYVVADPARRQPRRGRHPGAAARWPPARSASGRACAPDPGALGMFGAALFYGDGMITPAISVLTAVEGLEVATPALEPYVVPLARRRPRRPVRCAAARHGARRRAVRPGDAASGSPSWRSSGSARSRRTRASCAALDPALRASALFAARGWQAFVVLGAVVLAVTGAEALYADMGHFGRRPIRLAWFGARAAGAGAQLFRPGRAAAARPGARSTTRSTTWSPDWAALPAGRRSPRWPPSSRRRR